MPHRLPRHKLLLCLGALLGCYICCLSGCGKRVVLAFSPPEAKREGYVYVAQLINEHPLYPQYQRLEAEIAALRRTQRRALFVKPVVPEMPEVFFPAPEYPEDFAAQWAERRQEWELTLLPDRPAVSAEELAADLQAELQWQRRQILRWAAAEWAQKEALAQAAVAEARAAALRARQEALNNAGLNLQLPRREAQQAAEAERQRLWAEIEAETQKAREEAARRLEAEQAQLEALVRERIEAVEAKARQRMEKRTEIFLKSGSESRAQMSKEMAWATEEPGFAGAYWQPSVAFQPENYQASIQPLQRAEQRVRAAQADRLARARARLSKQLWEATALAVLRIAGLQGWRIYFPPEEPARGRNLTEQIRPELRRMYRP